MTNEQIEEVLRHVATREDLANLRADTERGFKDQLIWIIVLQLPNWLGVVGILVAILLHK
jgi:hypothetical protein